MTVQIIYCTYIVVFVEQQIKLIKLNLYLNKINRNQPAYNRSMQVEATLSLAGQR